MSKVSMKHFDKYAIVEKPCTLVIKNNSQLFYNRLYTKDGHPRWLLRLKAIHPANLELLEKLTEQGSIEYADINHLLIIGALWEEQVDNIDKLPVKGESVIATFDFVDKVLRCTNITLIPREIPKLYNYYQGVFNEIKELEKIINGG